MKTGAAYVPADPTAPATSRWIEVVDHRAKEILFRESAALYWFPTASAASSLAENFD